MENKDTSTDYQKFVGVRDQKWEVVEITIGIFFFCLRFIFTIFITGSFQVPPEKNQPHLKCPFPPKIPIWPKSLQYKPSEKWLSPPPLPPITQVQTMEQLHCPSFTFLQPFSILWQFYYSNAWEQNVFTIIKRKPVNNEK